MSDGDVSLIKDEDVLRRMWQQTEDFSRKKEIRAHMYRLREERLRNLYLPEPNEGKGVGGAQTHVKSLLDQSFQGLKSKEVRDAGSPPKDFQFRGQDLKELSNAGWNVESENKTTDDGHTHVRSVHANIEGKYDVDGGAGQFAAVDSHKQAVTEYQDENTSLKRNESSTDTAAHEQVVRKTDNGTQFSSTTSSSTSSKFQQVSSSKHEVPYNDYDLRNTNQTQVTKSNEYENVKSDATSGELVSRKVDYPDDNTTVIVETTCLPDGTKVTSTRREFRAPAKTVRSEEYLDTRSENKSYSTSSHHKSDYSSSKTIRDHKTRSNDIVDSQRRSDDYDFKRNQVDISNQRDEFSQTQLHQENKRYDARESSSKISCESISNQKVTDTQQRSENIQKDEKSTIEHHIRKQGVSKEDISKEDANAQKTLLINEDETNRRYEIVADQTRENNQKDVQYRTNQNRSNDKTDHITEDNAEQKVTSDQYQTTYQSDYTQKNRVSNDWSPTHQAWASTLRADSPSRPTNRASSPGSKYQSNISLRSSVSPEKSYRKPSSRGGSPTKTDRYSPSRSDRTSNDHSTAYSTHTVSETKNYRYTSPERRPPASPTRYGGSPDRKQHDNRPRYTSSDKQPQHRSSVSPEKKFPRDDKTNHSPDKKTGPKSSPPYSPRSSVSPGRKPGYMRPTASQSLDDTTTNISNTDRSSTEKHVYTQSSDKKTFDHTNVSEDHYKLIDEETKMYTRTAKKASPSQDRTTSVNVNDTVRPQSPIRPTLRKESRSPSPPKGPVTFTEDNTDKYGTYDKKKRNKTEVITTYTETNKSEHDSQMYDDKFSKKIPDSPTTPIKKTRNSVSPVKLSDKFSKEEKTSTLYSKDSTDTTTTRSSKITREEPLSPTKKHPRDSTSPINHSKYKMTSDFIHTERTNEETNKKKSTKNHPRQLVTPSTSPTRKPKTDEVLSSGQSSPTTSVSEFVYYGSPKTEQSIVTDLDDVQFQSEISNTTEEITTSYSTRPDSLSFERSPSPFKIPCRSPSPTKRVSPSKESLPRKSSLKKPIVSPLEMPPSTFQVSPTNDGKDSSDHKVVKKDDPNKPVDSPVKVKPPLERRETYEDRCRKILGMIDDSSSAKKVTIQPSFYKEPMFTTNTSKEETKSDVTDFISHEQKDTIEKTTQNNQNIKTDTFDYSKVDESTKYTKTRCSPEKNIDESARPYPSRASEPLSPYKKPYANRTSPEKTPQSKLSKEASPSRSSSPDKQPGYMKSTVSSDIRYEATTDHEIQKETTTKTSSHSVDRKTEDLKRYTSNTTDYTTPRRRSVTPEKPTSNIKYTTSNKKCETVTSHEFRDQKSKVLRQTPDKETGYNRLAELSKDRSVSPERKPVDKKTRASVSPDEKPGYLRSTAATTVKSGETNVSEESQENTLLQQTKTKHTSVIEKLQHSRTPSPEKTTEKVAEFIQTEREKEILDKVQKSLRKLSPTREHRSPSREKSPGQSKISLQGIEITETFRTDKSTVKERTEKPKAKLPKEEKPQEPKVIPFSRNVSPTKKPTVSSPPKSPETQNKSRSISTKKPVSPTERSQSPQVYKPSGIKPREPIPSLVRKATTTKIEKTVTEVKKSPTVNKQNSFTKTSSSKYMGTKVSSPSSELTPESKRMPTPKGINKENVSPKKDELKVTRTASDNSIKGKKSSPQRMRSKPEIQVSDLSPKQPAKQTMRYHKTETKLAPKPKSATALNTSFDDEDDIIIDVEQAKSSRENSPDRICPTPVNFMEDVGTPRLPDEVNEPDDDFRKRAHHTIHETESIVDDIVEICEDDELFVKNSDNYNINESDECLLSVTDKVSKFTNKIESTNKTKDVKTNLKDTEKISFADYVDETLKSDECLLSVSQKVNKFAQGPKEPQDMKSRKITDEYDTETVYQDNYTKLSVNDKAHFFVETAENTKTSKPKSTQKIERPDLSNVEESLKSDDCLLSVTDKVNKFVQTAEQFLNETHELEDKDKKIKEQYEKFLQTITQDEEKSRDTRSKTETENVKNIENLTHSDQPASKVPSFAKETASSHSKVKDHPNSNLKPTNTSVKITTLRSSEAVKKAKALFENIATTQKTDGKTTKLTDIGIRKPSQTDSVHSNGHEEVTDIDGKYEKETTSKPSQIHETSRIDDKTRSSPIRQIPTNPELSIRKTPARQIDETHKQTNTVTKSVLSRYPVAHKESLKPAHEEPEPMVKSQERTMKYSQRDETKIEKEKSQEGSTHHITKSSQLNEEKVTDDTEVSTRRGSGKFGVELRKTSIERSVSTERRRSSTDHHQPCIEDIFDLDLLEQMLEKVIGYEQRRRIRAQIRITKKKIETEQYKTRVTTTYKRSPERRYVMKSPERQPRTKPQTPFSSDRTKINIQKTTVTDNIVTNQHRTTLLNGHTKESSNLEKHKRPESPDKSKYMPKNRSPVRQPSPDKKTRTLSPSKTAVKPKSNRFNEYASAYMKKVGLTETEKLKFSEAKNKKIDTDDRNSSITKINKSFEIKNDQINNQFVETTKTSSISKSYTTRSSSKDIIETVKVNGKRSVSPEKKRSPERRVHSNNERLYYRSPSPDFKSTKSDIKETIIKTVYDTEPQIIKNESIIKTAFEDISQVDKKETMRKTLLDTDKKSLKQTQEEKPSWVTNRNLKKITAETRSFSSKKVDSEKPKYRPPSPSKVISKPIDVITSSYGPGPLDADGRPLFGIKALRKGATNYQVKGTVIRQEFHSRNGGEPEGSVSVTAYSTEPEDLERLLQVQGDRPSRLHGLAAITTTKKFGGDTGSTLKEAHSKEERAVLEQFTHHERRVETQERAGEGRGVRADRKNVRQSSVKSLTEKYIKNASETSKSERTSYPKAGLILRSSSMKDSISSDSSAHAGLGRTDSEHSLASVEDHAVTSSRTEQTSEYRSQEKSFLDSSTKVTGVQDILTRMKNADIVIQEGDTTEDSEARALLNKFLGATVLMAGMQSYVTEKPSGKITVKQETVRSSGTRTTKVDQKTFDPDQCWDEKLLRSLLEESTDYEQRRRLRARIRTLMAEQEACASAVTEALTAAAESEPAAAPSGDTREEAEVTVTSSERRNSSEKTVSSSTTTKTSKVVESMTRPAPKTVSPFAKFKQLEKQNSTNTPNSPQSPSSPAPLFKFTDPAVHASAMTIKERLLQWCRDKTRDYENVKLENFSTSWADGLAFCALVHHFLPDAFDYSQLAADKRRHNFTLAFKVADEKAGIYPLLDVDDMVAMRKPDWKCVFTYVQSIHRRFKDQP